MPFYQSFLSVDEFQTHCIGTTLEFTLFPKKCHISKKAIWLKFAYKQTAMWTGPGDPVFEHRWYDKTEFLVWNLKGKK